MKTSPLDISAEQRFIRLFIRKSRKDRLLYELTTPEKRYDGISRFCHQAKELLDPAKIVMEGEDLERRPEFERFVRQHDIFCLVDCCGIWVSHAWFDTEKREYDLQFQEKRVFVDAIGA